MTRRIGAAQPTQRIAADDTSTWSNWWRLGTELNTKDALGIFTYVTEWWPVRGGHLGDLGVDVGQRDMTWYEMDDVTKGMNSRLGYMGITRDVYNSPLPGATVKIFRTSTDEKVSPDIVSDAGSGEYVISTPYYEAHWLKVEKAGSPSVQGVSVNTIFPNV